MTTNRTDRRSNANPGTSMIGRLLDEWCRNANSDRRDWYSLDDRLYATQAFAKQTAKAKAQGRHPHVPAKLILIEGDRGDGKSAIANYYSTQFAHGGADVYHTGPFGYGRVLEPHEWYTAMNNVPVGSVVFVDEAASVNRRGRDQADIQAIQNEQLTALRKQQCLVIYASALSRRMGSVIREEADEIWRPQKMRVVLTDREQRRRRRKKIKPKDDPANYAYCVLRSDGKPYRPASLFDSVLGQEGDRDYSPPIYRTVLDPVWMRLVMPLLDTFKPVPIGAAMAVSREQIIDIATGREPQARDKRQMLRDVVIGLARAFQTETLEIPPYPKPGEQYEPTYFTVTELRNATDLDMSVRRFSAVLREDLRLVADGRKGYEILDLYEAVERVILQWEQQKGAQP